MGQTYELAGCFVILVFLKVSLCIGCYSYFSYSFNWDILWVVEHSIHYIWAEVYWCLGTFSWFIGREICGSLWSCACSGVVGVC